MFSAIIKSYSYHYYLLPCFSIHIPSEILNEYQSTHLLALLHLG